MFNIGRIRLRVFSLALTVLYLTAAACSPQNSGQPASLDSEANIDTAARQWHTITLNFTGPETSETAALNPFTHYRLLVEFTSGEKRYTVRGFYAADGKAAHSSANAGNIWQVRFAPDSAGDWTYRASLQKGDYIAISRDWDAGEEIPLKNATGIISVKSSDKTAPDFRSENRGRLGIEHGYFRFQNSRDYWLKGGTNSPENLLAYTGFDGTYRLKTEAREGEAAATDNIHSFTRLGEMDRAAKLSAQ